MVFVRSLHEEVRQKPLLHKKGLNRYLYQQLNKHLQNTITKTGLPVIWWDSQQQKYPSFAENFKHAFQYAFNQNYENVIAIGNDCPELNYEDILLAAEFLQDKKLVCGPAIDGGVYLMGFHRDAFNSEIFDKTRWQTSHVLHDLTQLSNFFYLSLKSDLDNPEDLLILSKRKVQHAFAMNIYLFLLTLQQLYINNHNLLLHKNADSNNLLRAPPLTH